MISNLPRNTLKYPGIPGNTQEYLEYPRVKKIPESTQSFISTPLPRYMGTFCNFGQKCPYSGAQKCDFECRYPKTKATFSCQHSPKMVEWTFVSCVYHFWVRNQQIFKKCTFWTVLSRFSLSTDPKIEMQSAGSFLKYETKPKHFWASLR